MMPDLPFDDTAIPIWEQLDAIGRSAPAGAWDAVPTDLSVRIDELVYGTVPTEYLTGHKKMYTVTANITLDAKTSSDVKAVRRDAEEAA